MFENRARGFIALMGVGQCLTLWGGLGLLANYGGFSFGDASSGTFGAVCWCWAAGIGAELLWSRDQFSPERFPLGGECLQRTVYAAVFAIVAGYSTTLKLMPMREVVALWVLCFACLLACHWVLPRVFARFVFLDQHQHRVVVVGDAEKVEALGRVLDSHKALGFNAVGWLTDNNEGDGSVLEKRAGIPFFGNARAFAQIVREQSVNHVILAGNVKESQVRVWKTDCERMGVRLVVAQNFGDLDQERFSWETQGDWCFGLACREPLQSPLNRALKRLLDLVVATMALVLAVLPVALLTWVAQRRQSPGSLFYRQWRHGRGNRPFQVWKFRTMHSGPMDAAVQAQKGDPRVFPFAVWLRRHSLDELPQFLNVLLGEMSVVGPRPHFVEHTGRFEAQNRYHVRSFVKPGITGLAQVNGCRGEVRSPADMDRRVRFDIRYVEEWSLWLDVVLIARTAWQVIVPPETAY